MAILSSILQCSIVYYIVYYGILQYTYSIRCGGHPSEQWGLVGAVLAVEEFELAQGF